jgi:DNA-binding SARP family transcriptional activator/Flp pilus assembly protein TadD
VRFRLLGPVQIEVGGRILATGRRRERALLAILLLEQGRVVPADRLCELLWDGDPPESARRNLQSHVARLRGLLAALDDPSGVRLTGAPAGYALNVAADDVDAHRFRTLVTRARATAELPERARLLSDALQLWRGPALQDAASPRLRARICADLDDMHLTATEDLLSVRLDLGQHTELVPDLTRLAAAHPVRERVAELLMLALYRAGRKADALDAYTAIRIHLAEALGADPGAALRELHQAILRDELAPAAKAPPSYQAPEARAAGPAPAQLPLDVAGFTGRRAELSLLDEALGADHTSAVLISAVTGTAGVGKTALALHWGHRVADRFPDGQLYADLRGYGPLPPAEAGDVLGAFLRALGESGGALPRDPDERAARFRTLVSGRRMLVVLDNACTAEQVRPLLPGSRSCTVVVTSRDRLAGLVARDGVRRLDLDLLSSADAVALLRKLIGRRADAEPDAVLALTERCARLPLALRVVAELAAARPDSGLADLIDELADEHRTLRLLDPGDDVRTAVEAVLSWSYHQLPPTAARAFRLLGLHPGREVDAYALAALADREVEDAQRLLDRLAAAHLLQGGVAGRYTMHDLLRAYATGRARDDEPEVERRAAQERLFDLYRATCVAAIDHLYPGQRSRRPQVPPARTPVPALPDADASAAWLAAQRPNLTAIAGYGADHGWPKHVEHLSATLWHYLQATGHYDEALVLHGQALRAARQVGDRAAEAAALRNLGVTYGQQGQPDEAITHYRGALELLKELDDPIGEARTRTNLGNILRACARYEEAAELHREALAVFEAAADDPGAAIALNNLALVRLDQGRCDEAADLLLRAIETKRRLADPQGEARSHTSVGAVYQLLGRYETAADHLQQALKLFGQTGDREGRASALESIGGVFRRQGRHEKAAGCLYQSVQLFREIGHREGHAEALGGLGLVHLVRGYLNDALDCQREALSIAQDTGFRRVESSILNGLGETMRAMGRLDDARVQHERALAVARDLGDRIEQARAHDGLAYVHQAAARPDLADDEWRAALEIYGALGLPDANQVRQRLSAQARP